MHDSETCYATTDVVLFQESNAVRQVRYGGLSARVRIAKGLSYRAGTYAVGRTRAPTLERIAAGTLCITDQRLIFLSDVKNLDLPFSRLLSCTTSPTTIEVGRNNSGRLAFDEMSLAAIEVFEQLSGTSPAERIEEQAAQDDLPRTKPRILSKALAILVVVGLLLFVMHRHRITGVWLMRVRKAA